MKTKKVGVNLDGFTAYYEDYPKTRRYHGTSLRIATIRKFLSPARTTSSKRTVGGAK